MLCSSGISTTHVSAEHAPYYIGWIRQAYEITGEKLTAPLSRDAEQETLQKLQARYQDWQVNRPNASLHRNIAHRPADSDGSRTRQESLLQEVG
jgi:hypothetical protein